jgi:hypothetical protein
MLLGGYIKEWQSGSVLTWALTLNLLPVLVSVASLKPKYSLEGRFTGLCIARISSGLVIQGEYVPCW